MKYTILDPTGNITALVEDDVPAGEQPAAAKALMLDHPEVEQVGFVRFMPALQGGGEEPAHRAFLRMAGGEFCGNASMSTAALYCIRNKISEPVRVMLEVSGTSRPVRVDLEPGDRPGSFRAAVHMPRIISAKSVRLRYREAGGSLLLVSMEGISHLIIRQDSEFFCLLQKPEAAEEAVKSWCRELSLDGLGLMFLQTCPDGNNGSGADIYSLTPLVYVPGSDTVFWEHSCASGTSAAAVCLAVEAGQRTDSVFKEPGGKLRAASSPSGRDIVLYGSVSVCGEGTVERQPMDMVY